MRNTRRLSSFIFLACGSLIAMSSMAHAADAVAIPIASPSALEYHNASNWFWGLNQGVGLALPLVLLITGWGATQYKFLARIFRARRVLPLASFAALYFLLDRFLRLPIAYRWDRAYGEASGTQSRALVPWLGDHLFEWILSVGGLILVVLFVYWLMEWSQRRWWLLSSAAVSIVVLAFLLVEPFTQSYKPLGNSPLELQIAELAARTGVPRSAIVVEHCDPASSCPPGRVIGMGPTRLILLNDALLLRNPDSWTLQTVAHEAKHFAKDDNIKALFLLSGLALVALWVTHRAGHAIIARWSGPLGFADFAHPASLPLAILLLNALYVVALPPVNAFRQHVELEADRFALELTRDNATQARMTASWASEKNRVPEWGLFFQLFRASHPSDAERIRLANTYHPWLEGKPLVYSKDFVAPLQIK